MKNLKKLIIDCHARCGIQDNSFDPSFEPLYHYDSDECKNAIKFINEYAPGVRATITHFHIK